MTEAPILKWRKDDELLKETRKRPEERFYENDVVFLFGFQLSKEYPKGNIRLVSRGQRYPDAALINEDTGEVLEVEFEKCSSGFKKHDVSKCDLIVCAIHDWKECPKPVYSITEPNWPSLLSAIVDGVPGPSTGQTGQ